MNNQQQPPTTEAPAPMSVAWFDAELANQAQQLAECIKQQARLEGAIQALQYLRAEAVKLEAPVPSDENKESPT